MPAIEELPRHPVAVDAFVLGDGNSVGRPTVTVATCGATRTILGLALSLEPDPSTAAGEVATADCGPDDTHAPIGAGRSSPLA